jgi:hypothetical protein
MGHGRERLGRQVNRSPAESLALCSSTSQAPKRSFAKAVSFKLRDRPDDCHLQTTSRGGEVQPIPETDDRDAQLLEFLECGNQVPKIPADAVEAPHHDGIESAPASIAEQVIQSWPAFLRTRDAFVGVLASQRPASSG